MSTLIYIGTVNNNLFKKGGTPMVVVDELKKELTADEYDMISYYIERAVEAYDTNNYSMTRAILEDAFKVLVVNCGYSTAYKLLNCIL